MLVKVATESAWAFPDALGWKKKHVEIETHRKGNTLDDVITRENELLPMDITVNTSVTSGYLSVIFGIPAPKPLSENKTTKYRRWKSLNLDALQADLSISDIHLTIESNSISDVVRTYNTILLIYRHAQEYDRTFKPRHSVPWYNSAVCDAKCLRGKPEHRWRKTSWAVREAYMLPVMWLVMS